MLIIMENRYIEHALQGLFYIEAFGRLDIFKVDTTKRGSDGRHHLDYFVRIMTIYLDVEHIHIGKFLKEYTLPFHHGFSGKSTAVTEAENGRTVRNNRNQIPF